MAPEPTNSGHVFVRFRYENTSDVCYVNGQNDSAGNAVVPNPHRGGSRNASRCPFPFYRFRGGRLVAPQKSPAFQFYAKDFLTGTATMSLSERGAYVSLLAHQWDAGSVPISAKERARILGCSNAEERKIWAKLVCKFHLANDAFQNVRLEEERQKQADYRRRQSDKGKASAASRLQPDGNHGSTTVESRLEPEGQPKVNSSSSSSSSKEEQHTHSGRVSGHGNGANLPGSLPRDHRFHVVCGARMRVCLSEKTGADLLADWGGDPAEALVALQRFCDEMEREIGDGPKGNHLWLLDHFDSFKARNGRVPVVAEKVKRGVNDAAFLARLEAIERGEIKR